jgi:hypothetical protein
MEGMAKALPSLADTLINSSTEQSFFLSLSLFPDRKVVFILKE